MRFGRKFSESESESLPQPSILSSLSGEVPVIANPWTKANCCAVCHTKLGVLKRHHCRFCGDTVCKEHAQHYQAHPVSRERARCCDICYKQLVGKDTKDQIDQHLAALKAAIAEAQAAIVSSLHDKEAHAKAFTAKKEGLNCLKSTLTATLAPLQQQFTHQREETAHTQAIIANLLSNQPHARELLRRKEVECAQISAEFTENLREVETLSAAVKRLKRDIISQTLELESRIPVKELNRYIGSCCRPNLDHISMVGSTNMTKYRESLYGKQALQSREIGKAKCKCEIS